MARCSRLFIFNIKEKFCVSARVGKSFTKCLLSEFNVRSSSKK